MASTSSSRSQTVTTSYEAVRVKIIAWGIVSIAIYLVYLIFFPLIPTIYHADHVLEIEQMLRHGRYWFAPLYVLGLAILFYAYWRELYIVHTFSLSDPEAAKSLRVWVLGIGLICALLLLGLYPITALDVVLYVVRARLWALYGGSPMLAWPANFPQDPFIHLGGEYIREVSPYGPLWELIAQIPIRLGILDIGAGTIAMKVIALISYLCMAVLIGWYARQDSPQNRVSNVTAMTFFALNPMVLLEAIGNGHNDMLMLALLTLGLVLWQRDHWAWAALALTGAALIKVTGLIFMPLFGMAVLLAAPTWRMRILRALGITLILLLTAGIAYRITGPFPDVFNGGLHAMFGRWGYTPAYAIRAIAFQIYHREQLIISVISNLSRDLFILYFAYLLIQLARNKITLIQAGFLAYFSQLLLGTTFRIWYPLWLVPFAALHLTSRTYWQTFLFSLTAELSILVYLILWRWTLSTWSWALHSPLKPYWNFWLVTTLITVPWVFGIPTLAPLLRRWKDSKRFDHSLWL